MAKVVLKVKAGRRGFLSLFCPDTIEARDRSGRPQMVLTIIGGFLEEKIIHKKSILFPILIFTQISM